MQRKIQAGRILKTQAMSNNHNKYAPYWALAFVLFLVLGLATTWFSIKGFWNSYLLDMVGPAWTYILFRGLFTAKANNIWTRFFTANKTVFILVIVSFGIESMQYFEIYPSTFDKFDLLAYISILFPIFIIDKMQNKAVKMRT